MSDSTKKTPNFDYPNNEPADLLAEDVDPVHVQTMGTPVVPKKPDKIKDRSRVSDEKPATIEEQENEDLEVDEGIESGIPERPGNVPRI